jgi:predicted transcriptional regulator
MSLAWTRPEVSVRDACDRLGASVAYTTVMTTMDRLFKKGLLLRRKVGRAFVYRAAATQQELENAVLSSLVDVVSERDRALLGELERLVREKRRAIDREREGKPRG